MSKNKRPKPSKREVNSLKEDTSTIEKGTTVLIVDEFGELGNRLTRKSRNFGFAISVTDDPVSFGKVTKKNRDRDPGIEKKAYMDSTKGRMEIIKEISDLGVVTRVYYVDKDNPPFGWNDENKQSKNFGRLFHHSIKDALPKKGKVMVIVDRHSAHKKVNEFLKSQSNDKRKVSGDTYDSASGPYSDLLQTQDYVAYAASAAVEYGNRSYSDRLKMSFKKFLRRDK